MAIKKWNVISWNVGGLGGKHRKHIVKKWVKSLAIPPLIIGLQEIKTAHFLTMVAVNVTQPDYLRIISPPHKGKGGFALLYHPSLKLIDS